MHLESKINALNVSLAELSGCLENGPHSDVTAVATTILKHAESLCSTVPTCLAELQNKKFIQVTTSELTAFYLLATHFEQLQAQLSSSLRTPLFAAPLRIQQTALTYTELDLSRLHPIIVRWQAQIAIIKENYSTEEKSLLRNRLKRPLQENVGKEAKKQHLEEKEALPLGKLPLDIFFLICQQLGLKALSLALINKCHQTFFIQHPLLNQIYIGFKSLVKILNIMQSNLKQNYPLEPFSLVHTKETQDLILSIAKTASHPRWPWHLNQLLPVGIDSLSKLQFHDLIDCHLPSAVAYFDYLCTLQPTYPKQPLVRLTPFSNAREHHLHEECINQAFQYQNFIKTMFKLLAQLVPAVGKEPCVAWLMKLGTDLDTGSFNCQLRIEDVPQQLHAWTQHCIAFKPTSQEDIPIRKFFLEQAFEAFSALPEIALQIIQKLDPSDVFASRMLDRFASLKNIDSRLAQKIQLAICHFYQCFSSNREEEYDAQDWLLDYNGELSDGFLHYISKRNSSLALSMAFAVPFEHRERAALQIAKHAVKHEDGPHIVLNLLCAQERPAEEWEDSHTMAALKAMLQSISFKVKKGRLKFTEVCPLLNRLIKELVCIHSEYAGPGIYLDKEGHAQILQIIFELFITYDKTIAQKFSAYLRERFPQYIEKMIASFLRLDAQNVYWLMSGHYIKSLPRFMSEIVAQDHSLALALTTTYVKEVDIQNVLLGNLANSLDLLSNPQDKQVALKMVEQLKFTATEESQVAIDNILATLSVKLAVCDLFLAYKIAELIVDGQSKSHAYLQASAKNRQQLQQMQKNSEEIERIKERIRVADDELQTYLNQFQFNSYLNFDVVQSQMQDLLDAYETNLSAPQPDTWKKIELLFPHYILGENGIDESLAAQFLTRVALLANKLDDSHSEKLVLLIWLKKQGLDLTIQRQQML